VLRFNHKDKLKGANFMIKWSDLYEQGGYSAREECVEIDDKYAVYYDGEYAYDDFKCCAFMDQFDITGLYLLDEDGDAIEELDMADPKYKDILDRAYNIINESTI
jgi:hypothetical protein